MDGPLPRPSHHCGRLYLALDTALWSHSVIADALKICCTWISPSQHEAQSKDKINRKFCQHCHLKSLLTLLKILYRTPIERILSTSIESYRTLGHGFYRTL